MLNYITWTADPAIITILGREIRWYGLMFAIGFWVGFKIVEKMFLREKIDLKWLDSLFLYVMAGTVIGARLGHCLFYGWDYYSAHPIEIFKIWEGGLASHGGAMGIIIAIYIYSKKVTHKSMLFTFDRLVVPVALVAALIRIGNLFNHEIYGHPTDLPWAFRYISNLHAWKQGAEPIFTAPSHPTQLYEATTYLLVFGLLMFLYFKKQAWKREGLIFGIFLNGIFLTRFFIEFIKNNQEDFEANMVINMGQILSLPFIAVGIWLIVRALKAPKSK
ncbi:MAG: prolipoprotein diacylglyceryl transferase [Bacteroidales bacterium]|nr:prolipoprotein diacylglyceryl transferase [Bacteroidales bacterium]